MAQPIRYLLEYSEHPYEEIKYEQGGAPDFSIEEWTKERDSLGLPFPIVPYLIDETVKVTDAYPIMIYIASAYAPELLGGTPEEKAQMDMYFNEMK